ncbi:phage portal protein [Salinithrix halophila]|uniref:Phage portal protein n=1 Tax=Salinithrix halophila TaxID=1485204 RepID=A0ABV8J9S3_9BACL
MLKGLIAKIKGVLNRMGLIKNIRTVSDLKNIPITDDYYKLITMWLDLYKGYLAQDIDGMPFHRVEYNTIGQGTRKRRMNTLRMPKIASEEMARLVFNEKCTINISDERFSEEIKSVFEYNKFHKVFQDRLEYMFALGGIVPKVYAETDRAGQTRIQITYATADCFVPLSYSNDHISEGLFVNVTRKGKYWYTLLEWHQWEGQTYVIRNQLFRSDMENELGVLVSLDTLYPDLEDEVRIDGLSRPLFVYIKPNIANSFDLQSPLGISLFANAIDTVKALDIAFDSLIREFRLGKKRIIVPATAIKTVVDPQTGDLKRYFDATDEAYEAFNFDMADQQKIFDNSVELRVEEHTSAIQSLLDVFAMQIGFSPGAFSFDGQGVKTATEVVSENSKTFRSKNSHETVIEEALKDLITSIGEVAELYGLFDMPADFDVTVDFDDSIAEDRNANADFYLKLLQQGIITKAFALEKILALTEEQAAEMVEAVREETATDTPDVFDMFGQDGGQQGDEGGGGGGGD